MAVKGAKTHKLWGDLYHGRGLFKEAVEEYEAAKLLAAQEGVNPESLESGMFIDDEEDDERLWKERASASKATTDEVLLQQRLDPSRRKKKD